MKTIALTVFASLALGSTASADVQLSIRDGRVSIVAKDATAAQILAAWATIGQTKVVNAERLPGEPMTIVLENASEEHALDVVLRSVGGYIAAARAIPLVNASRFDRIIVMLASVMPRVAVPLVAQMNAPPQYQAPVYQEQQAPFVQSQPAADDGIDPQSLEVVEVASPIAAAGGGGGSTARQALETVDPRHFKLPAQPQGGGAVAQPTRAVGGGVAFPGMVAKPR